MAHSELNTKPKRLSRQSMKKLTEVIQDCADEGFNVWGFLFKDATEESIIDIFNSHADPIPVFLVRTEAALAVIRNRMPENFNLEEQEQAVADALSGNLKKMPDGSLQPHLINDPKKVN